MKKLDIEKISPIIFIGPAFILFTIFMIYPTILGFFISVTNWDGVISKYSYVGIANFKRLINDNVFYIAVKNTFIFTIVTLIAQHLLALLLAELVDKKLKFSNFFRSVYFIPSLLATVVVGTVFQYIFNPYFGAFNLFLGKLGLTTLSDFNFIGNIKTVLYVIIFVNLWQWTGYSMVIYLGGLQAIDESIIESSKIDGAGNWQRFWKIKFPMIAPSFTINTLLTVIGSLKTFDIVYVMTSGGPGHASETIGTLIYSTAFQNQEFGYGTAMSLVLFVLVAIIGIVLEYYLNKREVVL